MNYYKRMTKVNIRDNVINNKKYDINKYENDGFEWYTAMKNREMQIIMKKIIIL